MPFLFGRNEAARTAVAHAEQMHMEINHRPCDCFRIRVLRPPGKARTSGERAQGGIKKPAPWDCHDCLLRVRSRTPVWRQIACAARESVAAVIANAASGGVSIPGMRPQTPARATRLSVVGKPIVHNQRPHTTKTQAGPPKSASARRKTATDR